MSRPQRLIVAITALCSFLNVIGLSSSDPLVDSNAGQIRGVSVADGDYDMFLGIPYAKVNDSNPFGPSAPYPEFEEIFEATDDSAMCPQLERFNQTITGSLDCLQLNVFVPRTATSQNKVPVMVFVYGGFFQRGYKATYTFGPKNLVRHDVILVTLNYRTGPYGFMCLDIPEASGNQGLKDQALALKWVKDNIEAFGGDEEKITVIGHSAGGHSVDFHLIYGDETLFQNTVLLSGSSLASTVIIEPERSAPQKIAEYLGTSFDSATEALYFLVDVDPLSIIEAVTNLGMEFKPCIEQEFDGIEPFITETWINNRTPKVNGKPIMVGFMEYERIANFANPQSYVDTELFKENLELTFNFNDEYLNDTADLVQRFYLGDESISEAVKWALINFESDFMYIHPIQRSISKYLDAGAANVFYYMFSHVGRRNAQNTTAEGAGHGTELPYLFDPDYLKDIAAMPEDQHVIDMMTKMLTNFAKYSDPTPETSDLLPVKWTPVSAETYHYLNIGSEISAGTWPVHERMEFWNQFYLLNEKSQKLYDCSEDI